MAGLVERRVAATRAVATTGVEARGGGGAGSFFAEGMGRAVGTV